MKEKGFTLIELLVVIAILGIIVAVVALNISNFFGMGRVQAANTELHQVETAITAYLADDTVTSFNGTIGPATNYPTDAPMDEGVHKYLQGKLQADYSVINGVVVNATPIEDSKWGDIHFCGEAWQLEKC
jgi:prepilin-type N-terminal cleavage/methylation domain-containing protein